MKNAEYGRLNDKLMDIRNMENNNMYDKLSMLISLYLDLFRISNCPLSFFLGATIKVYTVHFF